MPSRHEWPFHPVTSTDTSFALAISNVSSANALESTGAREWSGPGSRSIRIAETAGIDCYIRFGSTTIVAASTNAMLFLGNTVETFRIQPNQTHIAVYSSTNTTLNITLGYGA